MKTINKIFNGIRKIIAFPFTSAGILIMVCGIVVMAVGINISGNTDKIVNYLESIEDKMNEKDDEKEVEEKEE